MRIFAITLIILVTGHLYTNNCCADDTQLSKPNFEIEEKVDIENTPYSGNIIYLSTFYALHINHKTHHPLSYQ